MQHSIKNIGLEYENISNLRKDDKRFNSKEFFEFAKKHISKYSLIEFNDDLLVNTWYSGQLIDDYIKQL